MLKDIEFTYNQCYSKYNAFNVQFFFIIFNTLLSPLINGTITFDNISCLEMVLYFSKHGLSDKTEFDADVNSSWEWYWCHSFIMKKKDVKG